GVGPRTERAALAFSPSDGEGKLLSVETVTGGPKSFVLARLFDLKAKKEVSRRVLAEQKAEPRALGQGLPQWGPAQAYFTPKGEPRVLFGGNLLDGASGKVLHPVEPGVGLLVSPDGRYLVRLTRGQEKKMGVEVWGLANDG